jgi:hypothetical protein
MEMEMAGRAMILVLLIVLAPLACTRSEAIPLAPRADLTVWGVTATADGDQIAIRNGTSARIYFGTLERRHFESALAIWCFGHTRCGAAIEPGATTRVRIDQITGYNTAASEAIVFWWPDRPDPVGDQVAEDVSRIIVRLR